ncbi:hypothetical protein EWM64_g10296 [Hericium alpestre]|uniref:Uncharacterized protein n=1 Tax=Hericium alpestre TaxID=135208 RepID=A0A4Y9ZG27_9AGAM|nr:hypothetical protein EWM64_g10296 [Hericium alpestre]
MDSLYGRYSASSVDSMAVALSSPDATHDIDKPDSTLDNLLDCAVAVTDAQCAVVVEKVEAQLRAFEEHLALYQEDAARAYDELAQEHAESCAALRTSERKAFVRVRSTVDAAVSTTDLAIAKVDASTSTSDLHAGASQSSALDGCSTADLPRSSDLVPQTPLHTTPPADDIPFLQFPSRSPSHTPHDFAAQLKDKDDQIRILQTMVNDAVVNNVNMHPYAAFPGFHDPGPSELRTVDPAFLAAPDEHEIAALQAALRAKEEALNASAADVQSLRRALGEKDQEIDTLEKRCRRYQSKFVKTRKEFSSRRSCGRGD